MCVLPQTTEIVPEKMYLRKTFSVYPIITGRGGAYSITTAYVDENASHIRFHIALLLHVYLITNCLFQFSPVLLQSDGSVCLLLIISPRPGNWWNS